MISNVLGEALLDVERTFLNVVDHCLDAQARRRRLSPECLQDYLDAWSVLDQAHVGLLQFLARAERVDVDAGRSESLPL
jgi:hypothetical protein